MAHSVVGRAIGRAAQVLAFNDAFIVGAAIVLAGAVPALFLSSRTRRRGRR